MTSIKCPPTQSKRWPGGCSPRSALTSRARRARRLSPNGSRGRTPKHSRHRQRKSWRADNHSVGGSNPAFRFFCACIFALVKTVTLIWIQLRPHGARQRSGGEALRQMRNRICREGLGEAPNKHILVSGSPETLLARTENFYIGKSIFCEFSFSQAMERCTLFRSGKQWERSSTFSSGLARVNPKTLSESAKLRSPLSRLRRLLCGISEPLGNLLFLSFRPVWAHTRWLEL